MSRPSTATKEPATVTVSRAPLSVLVPCFNNEGYIEDCLRTVAWADELVVCDSFSTDRTVEIASRYADRVLEHEYINSATQKNWAIPQLTHDWVLVVDTDERIPPDLHAEIEAVLRTGDGNSGYRIPRANFLFGRWLRHGGEWPDYQIRLFRKNGGRYEPRAVHAHVVLQGAVGTLSVPIVHFPHQSLAAIRRTLLGRYARWEALQKQSEGVRFKTSQLLTRPAGAFVVRYLRRQGFRDGWQGLLMAGMWAAYVFKTYRQLRLLEAEASGATE